MRICARAFLKLGLQRHHSVCIIGANSPEWFFSSLGAIYAGYVKHVILKYRIETFKYWTKEQKKVF